MPIPFRDSGEEEHPGVAAYLRFIDEVGSKGIRGCLFTISSRGEPVEFSFTRVDVRPSVLWRAGQARSRAISSLAKALFESASHVPDLVLALASETPPEVFSEDLVVQVPVCRVATQDLGPAAPWEEVQHLSDSVSLIWVNGLDTAVSGPVKMVEILSARGLLLEPFDRAELGIEEAFQS